MTFSPLAGAGRRLLVARDGIYIEAANDALYVRLRLVALHTPYGELTEAVALRGARMPRAFARTLKERSLASHPCEMAALIVAASRSARAQADAAMVATMPEMPQIPGLGGGSAPFGG